jgi:hypothetical protein
MKSFSIIVFFKAFGSKFKNKKRFANKKLAPTCAVEEIFNFFLITKKKKIFF